MDKREEDRGIGNKEEDRGVSEEDLKVIKEIQGDFLKIGILVKEHKVVGILIKEAQDDFLPRIGVLIMETGQDLVIGLMEKILGDALDADVKHVKA